MKKGIFLAAAVIAAGLSLAAATDSDLETLLAQLRADEATTETEREALDDAIRADTRTLFRRVLIPVIEAEDLATARERAEYALNVLAAPGPADSASKRIHTATRRFGSAVQQRNRRLQGQVEDLIGP